MSLTFLITTQANAYPLVFQTLGGAFSLAAAQSAFVNEMIGTLLSTAPDINPTLIIATGATEIQKAFTPAQIPSVLFAYMTGLKVTFAMAAGIAGVSFLASFLTSWKRIDSKALEKTGGAA